MLDAGQINLLEGRTQRRVLLDDDVGQLLQERRLLTLGMTLRQEPNVFFQSSFQFPLSGYQYFFLRMVRG